MHAKGVDGWRRKCILYYCNYNIMLNRDRYSVRNSDLSRCFWDLTVCIDLRLDVRLKT